MMVKSLVLVLLLLLFGLLSLVSAENVRRNVEVDVEQVSSERESDATLTNRETL